LTRSSFTLSSGAWKLFPQGAVGRFDFFFQLMKLFVFVLFCFFFVFVSVKLLIIGAPEIIPPYAEVQFAASNKGVLSGSYFLLPIVKQKSKSDFVFVKALTGVSPTRYYLPNTKAKRLHSTLKARMLTRAGAQLSLSPNRFVPSFA
jgi:hypothetical protein